MVTFGVRLALGLALSLAIGLYGYRRAWLSSGGVLGAVLLGAAVFGFGGWVWAGLLVAFFASSSLLSHYGKAHKERLAEKWAKGSRRDLAQTLANGGVAALLAVVAGVVGRSSPLFPPLAFGLYGALATVNADTWATELGVLAHEPPRLITTGQPVTPGTSGGVTRPGLLASVAGALFIGLVAFVLIQAAALVTTGRWLWADWIVVPLAAAGGTAGALVDSLLGATVQAMYRCPACGSETERKLHRCGRPTVLMRGRSWLDNDAVNFLASVAGAAVTAALGVLFLRL